MNNYYEVKVRLERTMENGMTKKVKEPYLFDALSFSEAEVRAIEELAPFTSGELEVTDIKPPPTKNYSHPTREMPTSGMPSASISLRWTNGREMKRKPSRNTSCRHPTSTPQRTTSSKP